jgi:adenosylcobinamide kinase/adenosylcobinamide-phosphate guanylyltransferase
MTVHLVTGGARSGKSRFAEQLAAMAARPTEICFVATGVAMDAEMEARIARHRRDRPAEWRTLEVRHDVAKAIEDGEYKVYLIDCLSLLLNNWMFDLACTETLFWRKLDDLTAALAASSATCIVVTNEIGLGLVPADAESRRYRDWLGWMNQAIAKMADRVYFVASGIAIDLKQLPGSVVVR